MKIRSKIIAGVIIAATAATLTGCNSNKPDVVVESAQRETVRDKKMLYTDSYDMDITLDAEGKTLESTVTAKIYNNTENTLDEVVFRIPAESYFKSKGSSTGAEITAAYAGDKSSALEYSTDPSDPGIIRVSLGDKKLDPGADAFITLEVKEKIPEEDMRFGHFTAGNFEQFVLSDCFPKVVEYRDGDWMIDTADASFSQVADYKAQVHLPEGYIVVGTGVETPAEDGMSVNAVDSRDFAIVATNSPKSYFLSNGHLTINLYYPDGTKSWEMMENVFSSHVSLGTDWLEDFVLKYPWNQYDMVVINTDFKEGTYPGLNVIGGSDIIAGIGNDELEETKNAYEFRVSEALLKQWFSEIVGVNEKTDGWLVDGLAAWFADHMAVKTHGDLESSKINDDIKEMKSKHPEAMSMKLTDSFPDEDTAAIVNRYRGAELVEELFQRLGEDEFFAAMKDYFREYKYKEADTQGFLDIMRNHSKTELKQLIEEFV